MSQQQQAQTVPPEPNAAADHLSQWKSSCASTDVAIVEPTGIQAAVEATAPQRFSVDEITQRTPCDLQTVIKNLMFTVAYGTAMPTEPGDVYLVGSVSILLSLCIVLHNLNILIS